jgi:hypothetical protein
VQAGRIEATNFQEIIPWQVPFGLDTSGTAPLYSTNGIFFKQTVG